MSTWEQHSVLFCKPRIWIPCSVTYSSCGDLSDLCSPDCSRTRKRASETGGGEAADQHCPEESKGGTGAKDLQSRRGEIHQPCHNVRRHAHAHAHAHTHTHTHTRTHSLIYYSSDTVSPASAFSSDSSTGFAVYKSCISTKQKLKFLCVTLQAEFG